MGRDASVQAVQIETDHVLPAMARGVSVQLAQNAIDHVRLAMESASSQPAMVRRSLG